MHRIGGVDRPIRFRECERVHLSTASPAPMSLASLTASGGRCQDRLIGDRERVEQVDEARSGRSPAGAAVAQLSSGLDSHQALVLRVQHTAGNRAATTLATSPQLERRLLARIPHFDPEAAKKKQEAEKAAHQAEIDKMNTVEAQIAADEKAKADKNAKDLADQSAKMALSDADRVELRSKIRFRLAVAYTAFVSASKDVKDSLKAIAKARAEVAGMWVEIFTGFLAPGLSKGLAKFANTIPVESSNTAYRMAFAAMNTDMTKELFKSAAKVGSKALKDNSSALFGEVADEVFVTKLETSTQKAVDAISNDLDKRNDAELAALYAAYDPENANVDLYRKKIKAMLVGYKTEVLQEDNIRKDRSRLVRMDAYGKKRLAIIGQGRGAGMTVDWRLWSWVSPENEAAVKKQYADWDLPIIEDYDPNNLTGHLPDPDTEVEMGRQLNAL
jgi:hypothetical protein